jgi:hypothetical protein
MVIKELDGDLARVVSSLPAYSSCCGLSLIIWESCRFLSTC